VYAAEGMLWLWSGLVWSGLADFLAVPRYVGWQALHLVLAWQLTDKRSARVCFQIV
jgi:hypothetical protein